MKIIIYDKRIYEELLMKKVLAFALVGLGAQVLADETLVQKAKVYGVDTDISVEIKNKSDKPIRVFLDEGYGFYKSSRFGIIMPNETKGFKSHSKYHSIELRIGGVPINGKSYTENVYTLPKGKTGYVTWDGNKLYPQTGVGAGIVGRTDTGLSLGANVNEADLKIQRSNVI